MIVQRITIGAVIQSYDTETGLFFSQEFKAGDSSLWEFPSGMPVGDSLEKSEGLNKAYCAMEMVPLATSKAKQVLHITAMDPDDDVPVDVTIFKEESGGMGGVDSSYLANDVGPVYSPHGNGELEGI